jgi:hypothetical protein
MLEHLFEDNAEPLLRRSSSRTPSLEIRQQRWLAEKQLMQAKVPTPLTLPTLPAPNSLLWCVNHWTFINELGFY